MSETHSKAPLLFDFTPAAGGLIASRQVLDIVSVYVSPGKVHLEIIQAGARTRVDLDRNAASHLGRRLLDASESLS